MQYLNRNQFAYSTRYSRVGLGKDDFTDMPVIVRRIQDKEMTESSKVGDVTFTFWVCPVNRPGTVLRVVAMGLLAEKLEKTLSVDDNALISGRIVPDRLFGYVIPSNVNVTSARRPEQEEEHNEL